MAFAMQVISLFGGEVALVGISTDDTPVGRWVEKKIGDWVYQYFSIGYHNPRTRKPLIPHRMSTSWELLKYKRQILSLGVKNAMIQSPELLMVVAGWNMQSICYLFPGVENPLQMPRYAWGRPLAKVFDRKLFNALQKVQVILACADELSIEKLVDRSRGLLRREQITAFPTRVDTKVFCQQDKEAMRRLLKMPVEGHLIVTCGRINRVKGWRLVLDAFRILNESDENIRLIFIGDGEDREQLERHIEEYQLGNKVSITGFKPPKVVAEYLNASDVVVIGSHREGWSVAMLEALACGKPIVSTLVSGARDMILDGQNGFLITERSPLQFAEAVSKSLQLSNVGEVSKNIVQKYALDTLAGELGAVWEPLR